MTKQIQYIIKAILADRGYLTLIIAILVVMIAYMIFVIGSIESRDIQVVTQYSAFGESHFYKSRWFYLYSFVLLGLVVAATNIGIMGKLLHYGRRDIGRAVGWLTIIFFAVAAVVAHSVLQLAFL